MIWQDRLTTVLAPRIVVNTSNRGHGRKRRVHRMEQSRTLLYAEAVIIHRFTCLPLAKKAAPVGFGLKRAFL